jgi:hypothetical protein
MVHISVNPDPSPGGGGPSVQMNCDECRRQATNRVEVEIAAFFTNENCQY